MDEDLVRADGIELAGNAPSLIGRITHHCAAVRGEYRARGRETSHRKALTMHRVRLCSATWDQLGHLNSSDNIMWSVGDNAVPGDVLIIGITVADDERRVPGKLRPWLGSIHSIWEVAGGPKRVKERAWPIQADVVARVRLEKPVAREALARVGLLPGGRLPQHPTKGKLYAPAQRVRLCECLSRDNPRKRMAIRAALLDGVVVEKAGSRKRPDTEKARSAALGPPSNAEIVGTFLGVFPFLFGLDETQILDAWNRIVKDAANGEQNSPLPFIRHTPALSYSHYDFDNIDDMVRFCENLTPLVALLERTNPGH